MGRQPASARGSLCLSPLPNAPLIFSFPPQKSVGLISCPFFPSELDSTGCGFSSVGLEEWGLPAAGHPEGLMLTMAGPALMPRGGVHWGNAWQWSPLLSLLPFGRLISEPPGTILNLEGAHRGGIWYPRDATSAAPRRGLCAGPPAPPKSSKSIATCSGKSSGHLCPP